MAAPASGSPFEHSPALWAVIIILNAAVVVGWIFFMKSRGRQVQEEPAPPPELPEPLWEELFAKAEAVLDRTRSSLPKEIRAEAEKLPILLHRWSEHQELGSFEQFEQGIVSSAGGPLILFIGDIYEYSVEEELDFEEEVRVTFLHELGHHLGLDEGDLEDRGLA